MRPYLCAAGVPTIGYGTTRYPDGRAVTLRDAPITPTFAAYLLDHTVATVYAPAVARLCPGADTDNRRAALISFAYNLGVNALAGSTLRRKVNAQDWEGAKRELMRWVKAGVEHCPDWWPAGQKRRRYFSGSDTTSRTSRARRSTMPATELRPSERQPRGRSSLAHRS